LIDRLVVTDAPIEALTEAAEHVVAASAALDGYGVVGWSEGFAEAANSGDPHAHFDRSPVVGQSNPLAPPIRLEQSDDVIRGTAVFGKAYEGPPGCVHGGWIAAAFDEVLGMTQSMAGQPGMTAFLKIDYRTPTPLETELTFEGELARVEGRKIFTVGRVRRPDGVITAEAEALFVSVNFDKMFGLGRPGGQVD
jgi:acyl-coenzyme A thioesterase PaaI-like protein